MIFLRTLSRQTLCFLFALLLILISGGGTTFLSQLVAALALLVLLFAYPLTKPGTKLLGLVTVLLLGYLALITLAPSSFIPEPYWLKSCSILGVAVSHTITAQPLVSMVAVGGYLLAAGWVIWVFDSVCNKLSRRNLLHALAWLITLLALLSLLGNAIGWRLPWNVYAESFSFFPNKNQSALLYVVGALLMLGLLMKRWKTIVLLRGVYPVATGVCLVAALSIGNRSALLLFPLGVVLLMVREAKAKRWRPIRALFALGVLLLALGVLVNHQGFSRLLLGLQADKVAETSSRLLIWKDTLHAIEDNWAAGFGPGNFPYLISFYKENTLTEYALLHPENSWLWLLADGGLLLFLVLAGGAYLVGRTYHLERADSEEGYVNIAVTGLILIGLHSMVDVSLSRVGIIIPAAVFIACLLKHNHPSTQSSKPLLLSSCALLGAVPLFLLLWPHSRVQEFNKEMLLTASRAPHALPAQPLDWRTQMQAAHTALVARNFAEARRAFEGAQVLADFNPQVMQVIGYEWLPYSASQALSAWRLALASDALHRKDLFIQVMHWAESNPSLQAALLPVIVDDSALTALWIGMASNTVVCASLQPLLANTAASPSDFDWPTVDRALYRQLLACPVESLAWFLARPESERKLFWRCTILALAKSGQCEEALELGLKSIPLPFEPKTLSDEGIREARVTINANPKDAYHAQRVVAHEASLENWPAITLVIRKIRAINPSPPPWLNYWQIRTAVAQGKTQDACTALVDYLGEL